MISLTINNPTIESYFEHSQSQIEKILELIAVNKIDVIKEFDLQVKLAAALKDVADVKANIKTKKKARDFLNEL